MPAPCRVIQPPPTVLSIHHDGHGETESDLVQLEVEPAAIAALYSQGEEIQWKEAVADGHVGGEILVADGLKIQILRRQAATCSRVDPWKTMSGAVQRP